MKTNTSEIKDADCESGRVSAGLRRRAFVGSGLVAGVAILAGGNAWRSGMKRSGGPLDVPQRLSQVRASGPVMGTVAEVTLFHASRGGEELAALAAAALEEIRQVEARMTRFDARSDIGQVNAAPGQFFAVSPMTGTVVRTALQIARASDGRFDPGLGELEALWGFYDRSALAKHPDPEHSAKVASEIAAAMAQRPVFQRVELAGSDAQPRLRITGTGVQLDLGGIAKGYAVDRAVALLRSRGVEHALVNAGGDLYALGGHPEGRPWQVGVRHPRIAGRYLAVLPLQDQAVATSGDYENFYTAGEVRYHHLLNPRTGRPAPFHRSVSVTASSAMTADALATAAFAAPPRSADRLLRRLAPHGWLTVDAQGAVQRG